MEALHNFMHALRDSTINFYVAFLFFLFSTWIRSFIQMGITFALAPLGYSRVNSYSIFGYLYQKQDDKFVFIKKNSLPIVQAYVCYDYKKYPNIPSEKANKADLTITMLVGILTFIVSSALGVLLISISQGLSKFLLICIGGLAFGLIFNGLLSFIFSCISVHKIKTSLAGYLQQAIGKIRAGEKIQNLNLKPVSELPYEKVMRYETIMYSTLYFIYLETLGEIDKLKEEVEKLKPTINSVQFSIQYIGAFMNIVYFHCFYDINPEQAKTYMNPILHYLEKDKDANSYRVRAFYELVVNENPDLAYKLANQAHTALPSYSMGAEREHEKVCIDNLFKAIDEYVSK